MAAFPNAFQFTSQTYLVVLKVLPSLPAPVPPPPRCHGIREPLVLSLRVHTHPVPALPHPPLAESLEMLPKVLPDEESGAHDGEECAKVAAEEGESEGRFSRQLSRERDKKGF